MAHDDNTATSEPPLRRLDHKLGRVLDGSYTNHDFIIADAKDADMAYGAAAAGPISGLQPGPNEVAMPGVYRTRRQYLDAISTNPGVRAPDLAERFGRDVLPFKADVRKLKNLGLTLSLRIGYELSPRGAAYLTNRRDPGG